MRKLTIAALLSSLGPLLAYQPAYAQGSGAVTITPPAYGELMVRYCLSRVNGSQFCKAHYNRYATYALCEKARALWAAQVPDPRDPTGATMVPLLKLSIELEGSEQWEVLEARCYGESDTSIWQLQFGTP
jgi:hypothetical protein